MKTLSGMLLLFLSLESAFVSPAVSGSVITTGSGNWSSMTPDAPWPGGILPAATDDVVVADGTTLEIDQDATVASLTVGQGVSGVFQTSKTILTNLTINGNLTILSGGSFKAQTATTSFSGPHTLSISGNITHSGTVFDLRVGTSGTTLGVINTSFVGSTNSTVTINGTYSSTNGDFNAVTINKSGGAKVILASDVLVNGGSSTGPATMNSIVMFVNGIVETGNFTFIAQTSTAANVTGASNLSYVLGAMGRGMSNSGGSTKDFPVGDANGYRPLNLRSTTAGTTTGHHAIVRLISGNANTGSSVLNGGIDRVSSVRYYRISYSNAVAGAATMSFDRFYLSYGADDGVVAGNTDLRVAYSTDNRATWTKLGQNSNPHTTDLTSPPTQIKPDSVNPAIVFTSGVTAVHVALADTLGGGNPLPVQLASFTGTYVSAQRVRLEWRTVSEINNYGFTVQRKREFSWTDVANSFIAGHGTTNEPRHYSYTDNIAVTGRVQYRLKQQDLDGTLHFSEPITVSSPMGVEEQTPTGFSLYQNYPNPFNPTTDIMFSVDKAGQATLDVFNLLGEKVATLFNEVAEAGKYYQVKLDARDLSSGTYLYRLQRGASIETRRMLLLK